MILGDFWDWGDGMEVFIAYKRGLAAPFICDISNTWPCLGGGRCSDGSESRGYAE